MGNKRKIGADDAVATTIYAGRSLVKDIDEFCRTIQMSRSEFTRNFWAKTVSEWRNNASAYKVDLNALGAELDRAVKIADRQRYHLQKIKVYEQLSRLAEEFELDTDTFSNAGGVVEKLWNYKIGGNDVFNRGHVKLMISLIELRKANYDLEQRILQERKRQNGNNAHNSRPINPE